MLQVIFDDLTFNEKELKTYYKEQDFHPPHNKEYNTIAIIGCQSSGKSTLLNHIFNTNFEVMSDDIGRGQTTKGIWTAISKETSTIIYDVEGTDAKERGDNRLKFENCSSLFALAMADVLMINMWTSDIGRYTASNYGVLKVVFEMNLQLFQQECEKKIVVVLRDFDENNDDKDRLAEGIFGDLKQIWNEIKKPEKYVNCKPEEFFKFEFFTLPHKFYFPELFEQGINEIKKQLLKDSDKYIFNHVNYEKNVPIDGLFQYTWNMWSSIINNKDLNIPGQKEMLARFRCNEIKDRALEGVEQVISDLELESSMKKIDDYKERCNNIIKRAMDYYDDTAKGYLKHIYQDVKLQLDNTLSSKLYPSFANQMKLLIPKYQKKFREELERRSKSNENFGLVVDEVKKEYLCKLSDELKDIQIYESWDLGENNEELFNEIIENQEQVLLNQLKYDVINDAKNLIDDSIQNRLELINSEFWNEVNQDILTNLRILVSTINLRLKEYFKIDENRMKNYVQEIEKEVHNNLKQSFIKNKKSLNNYITENFKNSFWYSEGIPRPWAKISEQEINELYQQSKKENLGILDIFKTFKVIENPISLYNYKYDIEDDDFNLVLNQGISDYLNDKNNNFDNLLENSELDDLKLKFSEEIQDIYQDAIRRHYNISQTSIPIVAWILLIYLSYDDIFHMLTGHWLIPAIIVMSLYGLLQLFGLGNLPFMIINIIKSQISGKQKQN